MSMLASIPLWGYFLVLGAAFVTGHVLAFRGDPAMARGRRLAGRWGSSLLLLLALLIVSSRHLATVLLALLLALLGGVLSGRTAPPPRSRTADGRSGPTAPVEKPPTEDDGGVDEDGPHRP